jgi:hypothetical protein
VLGDGAPFRRLVAEAYPLLVLSNLAEGGTLDRTGARQHRLIPCRDNGLSSKNCGLGLGTHLFSCSL